MSESLGMQWQGLVSMFLAHITLNEHEDVPGHSSCWGPCVGPGAVHNWPRTSLDAMFWSVGPISHQRHHVGEQVLWLAQVAQ